MQKKWRLAINGYGRIGRQILRAFFEDARWQEHFELVMIRDPGTPESVAHLTRYDTTHGPFSKPVALSEDKLCIQDTQIALQRVTPDAALDWRSLNIDLLLECSGQYVTRQQNEAHLAAGASKVLVGAPCKDADLHVVYGVNHLSLHPTHQIVSNSSCTTNAAAPVLHALGVENLETIFLSTIHAYTSDQRLLDGNHSDLRRARAAAHSIIPTKTGATGGLEKIFPELIGKIAGMALRVPTLNVSALEMTLLFKQSLSVQELVTTFTNYAAQSTVLAVNTEPLVSVDFNHQPASVVVDLTQIQQVGPLVHLLAWYDNEWAFAQRMLDTALALQNTASL